MNSNKCRNCHLVNHGREAVCRRCGMELAAPKQARHRGPRDEARRGFPYSIILVGAVVAFFVYAYSGVQSEMSHIEVNEAKRAATAPKQEPAGLSRTQSDQQRAGQYKNAIQSAPALAQSQKRLAETEKLMQPDASRQK